MKHIIEAYKLEPHPEGGYFREIYRSASTVTSTIVNQDRNSVTHIYFMLTKGQISRFHKVRHDEIWNFYEGAPLRLIQYDGSPLKEELIGPACNSYVSVVKGDIFQAAESTGEYSLVGCSVAPGFDFNDFSFLHDDFTSLNRFKKPLQMGQKFVSNSGFG